MGPAKPLLSLVIPAYNEVDSASEIADFYRAIRATYTDVDFELIVVDDGSTDGTREALLQTLAGAGPARIVTLSRNFGSHAGISAGFAHCRGRCRPHAQRRPAGAPRGDRRVHRASGSRVPTSSGACARCAPSKKGMGESFARVFSKLYGTHSDVPNYPAEGPSQILMARRRWMPSTGCPS